MLGQLGYPNKVALAIRGQRVIAGPQFFQQSEFSGIVTVYKSIV